MLLIRCLIVPETYNSLYPYSILTMGKGESDLNFKKFYLNFLKNLIKILKNPIFYLFFIFITMIFLTLIFIVKKNRIFSHQLLIEQKRCIL